MNKIKKFKDFVKKHNQYTSIHNRIVKKCGWDSTILDVKVIPMTSIYKLFKEFLIRDNTQITDDNLILLVIYIFSDKLQLDFNKTKLLQEELEFSIPDFKTLKKKFWLSIQNLLIITNILYKDKTVINNFDKFLNLNDVYKIINDVSLFAAEHNMGLKEFSYIIVNKNQKVLKNIINYNKNENKILVESSKYLPEYLYHLTSSKKYETIKTEGLDPKYSIQSKGEYGIYLSDDQSVSANYSGFYENEELVLLKISTKGLNINYFGPDDYELQDYLNSIRKGRKYDHWYDVPWYLSLRWCSEIQYHSVIPPENIEVIDKWIEI